MDEHLSSHLFLCTDRPKSWTTAIDYAARLYEEKGIQSEIVLFSRAKLLSKSHLLRNRELKRLAKLNSLKVTFYRFSIFNKFPAIVKGLLFVIKTRLKPPLSLKPFDEVSADQICKAYWAAKSGAQHFKPNDISNSDLFYAVSICLLYRRMLESKFGITLKHKMIESTSYLWNGREPEEASLLSFLIRSELRYKVFERGSKRDTYELWNSSPHFYGDWWQKLDKNWKRLQELCYPKQDYEEALSYAASKSGGYDPRFEKNWLSKMGERKEFHHDTPYITFFTSSTKEYAPSLEMQPRSPLGDQFDAVATLVEIVDELGIDLVIKRHPNSISKNGVDIERYLWEGFGRSKRVTLIQPSDEFDSYRIADNALCSFVWISSIGFDLIHRGLNTRAIGPAYWAYKDSFRAYTREEIIESLYKEICLEDRQELIFNYGNLMTNSGQLNNIFHKISKRGAMLRSSNRPIAIDDWVQARQILGELLR